MVKIPMDSGYFKQIKKSARQVIQPASQIIQKYRRDRQRREALDEALSLDRESKYAEAAEVYTRMADQEIQANQLIYQLYAHDAFREWLKAKNVEKALQIGRDVLRLLADTGWLGNSSDAIDDLSQMVGELFVAGCPAEAEALSKEINTQLAAHGVAPRTVSAEAPGQTAAFKGGKLPAVCPQCGGMLPPSHGADEIKCPYCGSVIRAA
jgi:primosomal protein N'